MNGADCSWVSKRNRGSGKIFNGERTGACLLYRLFIRGPELAEVQIFAALNRRYEKLAAAIWLGQVDGDTQIDMFWAADCWLIFVDCKECVHLWHCAHCLDHGVTNDVCE